MVNYISGLVFVVLLVVGMAHHRGRSARRIR